ncbi:carboxymuconolactone decarboxylase family protein [Sulfitobacter sp. MF3-043]|uniref:carboxymuconolactone decarboxylase family protein n=1 Tax=Sulfitobacter sediminivivens TaxID=3252902 RepID=UPI003EBFA466
MPPELRRNVTPLQLHLPNAAFEYFLRLLILHYAVVALNTAIASSGTDTRLMHLIKIWVSQINGCALCVGMHTTPQHQAFSIHSGLNGKVAVSEVMSWGERVVQRDALTLYPNIPV